MIHINLNWKKEEGSTPTPDCVFRTLDHTGVPAARPQATRCSRWHYLNSLRSVRGSYTLKYYCCFYPRKGTSDITGALGLRGIIHNRKYMQVKIQWEGDPINARPPCLRALGSARPYRTTEE